MKYGKFAAPIMAGALTLTLGLVGCGGNNQSPSESAEASQATESTEDAGTNETGEDAVVSEDTVIFMLGESSEGDTVIYTEDWEDKTATLLLMGTHNGKEDIVEYSGRIEFVEDTVTISYNETGTEFSFTYTTNYEEGVATIDMGKHGTATIKPVTKREFEEDVNKYAEVLGAAIGRAIAEIDDKDLQELVNRVEAKLAEAESGDSANNANATSTTDTATASE